MQISIPLEIKTLSNRQFEGYGSIFGNVDLGGDVVMPGAFKQTLAEHRSKDQLPLMLWMHQLDQIPGKWLDMQEEPKGLYVKGELAKTQLGDEVHTLLGMKAVRGLSIGYMTKDYEYDAEGNRLLKQVDLLETSVVSLPMNPLAQIEHVKTRLSKNGEYVPSKLEMIETLRELERWLHSKGFSKNLSKMCAIKAFNDLVTGEMPDNDGAMPNVEKTGEMPERIKTPEEIELDAGMNSITEKLLARRLEETLRRINNV